MKGSEQLAGPGGQGLGSLRDLQHSGQPERPVIVDVAEVMDRASGVIQRDEEGNHLRLRRARRRVADLSPPVLRPVVDPNLVPRAISWSEVECVTPCRSVVLVRPSHDRAGLYRYGCSGVVEERAAQRRS